MKAKDVATGEGDSRWLALYRTAIGAMIAMFVLIILQIIIYSIWLPPSEALPMLELMRDNWLLGLLSMDLLYLVDCVLLAIIYLALYVAIRRYAESAMLIATVLGLLGIAAYFASNPAFELLYIGRSLAKSLTLEDKVLALGAGRGFMETYKGTAFNVYYVLNTLYLFIVTPVMHKSRLFGRACIIAGFSAAFFMIIPSSAGTVGLVFSLLSLLPWLVWLLLVAGSLRRLIRRLTPAT